MVLANGWSNRQVDYTNEFKQAELKEEVYIEPPKDFQRKEKKDLVVRLLKSLYGLKHAPKSFFDKLTLGLIERGFKQFNVDKCLFTNEDMICVVFLDDTIIAGLDLKALEDLISTLVIAEEEQFHSFELRDKGEVGDF